MTQTTPASALRGSRRFILNGVGVSNASGTNDITTYMIGNSTTGITIGGPCRITKLEVFGNITALSADATFTVTAYKGSVSAGTRILETTIPLTAIAEVSSSTTTPTNAGMDVFTATDTLIVRFFFDATADDATITALQIRVYGEWDD